MDLMNLLTKTSQCSGVFGTEIEDPLANIIHYVYLGIQVVIPILLIIFGMIDLGKAITAQKEDEIKKAQSGFLKKLILAVIVFLVFSIVKLVFSFASGSTTEGTSGTVWSCINDLLN